MIAEKCSNCGSKDIGTDGEQVLYLVEELQYGKSEITTLVIHWCNTCNCKFVW